MGGFLYVTLGSIGAGMTASAVRWAIVDSIHHSTGIIRPNWNDAMLSSKLRAFEYLVENHYRYYQFYGNSLVSLLFAYSAWRLAPGSVANGIVGEDVGVLLIAWLFFAGSRDALRKYYFRVTLLLGSKKGAVAGDQRKSSGTRRGRAKESQDDGTQLASQTKESAQDEKRKGKLGSNDEAEGDMT